MTTSSETSGRRRGRSRDPIRTRAHLLLAAREVFQEQGLQGARTSEIAKRAGVPQGLIYHYFEGKEHLFRCVLEEALEPYFRSTIEMLETGEPGQLDLLERAIRMHFEFLRRHPHVPRLMAWWQADHGWQHGPLLPDEKAELCELPYELGIRRIREGQERGAIRPEVDPLLVIESFLSLSMSWHVNAEQNMAAAGIDPADPAAVDTFHRDGLEHIVGLVLHGVATDRARPGRSHGGPCS